MLVRVILIYLAAIFAIILGVHYLVRPAGAHSWYTSEHNEVGNACCGGSDCAAVPDTAVTPVPGGYEVHIPAGFKPAWPAINAFVPNARAKPAPTSGDYHLCYWGAEIRCFFFPAPSF